ncbi:MAG: hypothetical protein U9N81_11900 [Bacillota bacterium]|nr:hypothetical protein [Bacillota bacterium]
MDLQKLSNYYLLLVHRNQHHQVVQTIVGDLGLLGRVMQVDEAGVIRLSFDSLFCTIFSQKGYYIWIIVEMLLN